MPKFNSHHFLSKNHHISHDLHSYKSHLLSFPLKIEVLHLFLLPRELWNYGTAVLNTVIGHQCVPEGTWCPGFWESCQQLQGLPGVCILGCPTSFNCPRQVWGLSKGGCTSRAPQRLAEAAVEPALQLSFSLSNPISFPCRCSSPLIKDLNAKLHMGMCFLGNSDWNKYTSFLPLTLFWLNLHSRICLRNVTGTLRRMIGFPLKEPMH